MAREIHQICIFYALGYALCINCQTVTVNKCALSEQLEIIKISISL
jgi:hypothetical protein